MFDNLTPREDLLLEMIDIAIGAMVENELCSYCAYQGSTFCYSDRNCEDAIFEGLKTKAKIRLQKQKDELGNKIKCIRKVS